MAIFIPHTSRAGISVAHGGRVGPQVGASAFMTPGQQSMPGALNQLAAGMDKLGGAVLQAEIQKQQELVNADMLQDEVRAKDRAREFFSQYVESHQGQDAVNAAETLDEFYQGELDGLRRKWGGNPDHLLRINHMYESSIRMPGMERATAYGAQQLEEFKLSALQGKYDQTMRVASDSSVPLEEKLQDAASLEWSMRENAGQTFVVETGEWTGGRNIDANIARMREGVHLGHIDGMMAAGQYEQAESYLQANRDVLGGEGNRLSVQIQNKIDAERKAREVEARVHRAERVQALGMQVQDVEYLASQSGDGQKLRELGDQYTALGEQQMAGRLYACADMYESNAAAIRESSTMLMPDLAAEIGALDGKLAEALRAGDADLHQRLMQERNIREEIYATREKLFREDAAQAVEAEANRLLADQQGDITSIMLTNARMAAQIKNGVPPSMRRVLTNREAVAAGEQWRNGSDSTRWDIALSLHEYGEYAGAAAAEIGLSAAEQILVQQAASGDPSASRNLRIVITAVGMGKDELPNLGMVELFAKEAVNSSEVVRATRAQLEILPDNADLQANMRNYQDTLERLLRVNGGDVDAAKAVLDGKFRSVTGKNFALLFDPTSLADPRDVETGLKAVLDGPAVTRMADNRTDFADKYDKESWIRHMRRDGVWMNAPDGDGYVLFDPVTGAPAHDGAGIMLRVRDKELRGAYSIARFTPAIGEEWALPADDMGITEAERAWRDRR